MPDELAVAPPATQDPPIENPYKGRADAVSALTMSAYSRASTLMLTPEEVKLLQADFPDEAFRKGASGKDTLIYIEHPHLRNRLNETFGPGQWAVIPRHRWTEDFTTSKNVPGVKVYVEAMLLIRGCFVAEAVGDMDFWPKNESTNFGDAVEGAKTAALRRCAKELGIGLQSWNKSWCEGWWKRNPTGRAQPNEGGLDFGSFVTPDQVGQINDLIKQIEGGPDFFRRFMEWVKSWSGTDNLAEIRVAQLPVVMTELRRRAKQNGGGKT
jgi:hypothetical protein